MKNFFLGLVVIILTGNLIMAQDVPFNKGVNLTEWFQTPTAKSINFSKYTKQDIINIKKLGADVIRLPINMHGMTNGAPDYKVDTLLFYFLDQVIDWTEELGVNLILDNHSFDPAVNTEPSIENILIPVWQQFAERFKDRSNLIYYEILNEPHGISDITWNSIQGRVINEIRNIDSVHTIIVGPASWNSYNNLKNMPIYLDTNLVYTFHFYDPFIFTHQGASWTDPSMEPLANVPFPYDATRMPTFPTELIGSWIQSSFNSYSNDGTISKVKQLIDIAVSFKNQNNVKLFCGEFGVYIPNSNNDDRVYWYEVVRSYLEENGIAWTTWDYQGGFGLFYNNTDMLFDYHLNLPLLNALGFNEIEQKQYQIFPDSTNVNIYGDYIESGIIGDNYINSGEVDFYSNDSYSGLYSLKISNISQYNYVGFNFVPNKDLSYLANETPSYLSFYLKVDNPLIEFDIRFLDSKTDVPEDHPWRRSYSLTNNDVPFDGQWHLVQLALTNFYEQGSWDNNQWYDPIGVFDWSDVDRFQIVAEHSALTGTNIWFDDIKIVNPTVLSVNDEKIVNEINLEQNYPNPFNPETTINYSIPNLLKSNDFNSSGINGERVVLNIYDVLGRKIKTLVNKNQKPGNYSVIFNGSKYSSGIYYYQLIVGDNITTKTMILMK